ncbi:MAG: hypothetical protein ACK55Z_29540, partial [bacterium]
CVASDLVVHIADFEQCRKFRRRHGSFTLPRPCVCACVFTQSGVHCRAKKILDIARRGACQEVIYVQLVTTCGNLLENSFRGRVRNGRG